MKKILTCLIILLVISCATKPKMVTKKVTDTKELKEKDELIQLLKKRIASKQRENRFLEQELEKEKQKKYEGDDFGSAFNFSPAKVFGIVEKGDCLWNISKEYFGNAFRWREIYRLNKNKIDNPNLIYIGQKLELP